MACAPSITGTTNVTGYGAGIQSPDITLPTSGVTFIPLAGGWGNPSWMAGSEWCYDSVAFIGGWGTEPNLGSDPDDLALADIVHQGSGGNIRTQFSLPAADATQAFEIQVIVLNTWNQADTTSANVEITLSGGQNLTLTTPAGGFGGTGFGLCTFNVPANSGATNFWVDSGVADGGDGILSDIIVSNPAPTPEPATMGLLAVGGIGALLRRRKA
jgi:hypothetical protein